MLTLISSVVVNLSPTVYKLCIKYIKPVRFMYGSVKSLTHGLVSVREASAAKER